MRMRRGIPDYRKASRIWAREVLLEEVSIRERQSSVRVEIQSGQGESNVVQARFNPLVQGDQGIDAESLEQRNEGDSLVPRH